MIKKRILSVIASAACAASVLACLPAASASAVSYSDNITDGNLIYRKVDIESNGEYDYAEVVGCKEGTTTITIPASEISDGDELPVSSYVDGCFNITANSSLSEITVSENNRYFSSENGVLFNKDKTTLYSCPIGKPIESYKLPTTVEAIAPAAFRSCEKLSDISLISSSNIKSIGSYAFYNCAALANITIPSTVNSIGAYAFEGTEIMKKQLVNETGPLYYADTWLIKCDDTITAIIDDSKTQIKNGTVGIADQAFMNCSKLTEITIPDTISYVGASAFYNCTSLSKINNASKVIGINDYAFAYCTSLINYVLSDSVKEIGVGTFQACENLNSITLSKSLISIPDRAFEGCTNLLKIELPAKVESIGEKAFYDCKNLNSITINNKDCVIADKGDTISNTSTKIIGIKGSTAETYANNYQRVFSEISAQENPTDYPRGDANKDGKVNIRDAAYIARFAALGNLAGLDATVADYNADGKVNIRDAAAIARDLVNKAV